MGVALQVCKQQQKLIKYKGALGILSIQDCEGFLASSRWLQNIEMSLFQVV